jgi:hypothetical protein
LAIAPSRTRANTLPRQHCKATGLGTVRGRQCRKLWEEDDVAGLRMAWGQRCHRLGVDDGVVGSGTAQGGRRHELGKDDGVAGVALIKHQFHAPTCHVNV